MTMKKYIFPLIITSFLVLCHIGITDMKALTDKELNSVTGQAGIKGFDSAFDVTSNKHTTASGDDVRKRVFDEVFVKKAEKALTDKELNSVTDRKSVK